MTEARLRYLADWLERHRLDARPPDAWAELFEELLRAAQEQAGESGEGDDA